MAVRAESENVHTDCTTEFRRQANGSTSLHGVEPHFEILRPRRQHGLDLGPRDRLPFDEFPFAYAGDHGLDQQLVRYAVLAFDLRRHACHLGRRAAAARTKLNAALIGTMSSGVK